MGITRRWALIALVLYLAAVGLVLLLPIGYSDIVRAVGGMLDDLGIGGFGTGWIEFAGNVAMFIPLGLLLTIVIPHHLGGFALAVVLSALAEIAQVVIPSRQPSLRDVIANSLGAAVGALIAWVIIRRNRPEPRRATRRAR